MGRHYQVLGNKRGRLATIASIVRFEKGEKIYGEGDSAKTIFNIIAGVVTAYKITPKRCGHIAAFFYPEDLFGLSEKGQYANSTRALTPVTAYSIPVRALWHRLSSDADLQIRVIMKLCQGLHQAQHHALLLAQRHALSRLAMFLQMQEDLQSVRGESTTEIYLPMRRSDIADYVGLSLAAVSRAFRSLTDRRIIRNRDLRHVKIINRRSFEKLAGNAKRIARSTAK